MSTCKTNVGELLPKFDRRACRRRQSQWQFDSVVEREKAAKSIVQHELAKHYFHQACCSINSLLRQYEAKQQTNNDENKFVVHLLQCQLEWLIVGFHHFHHPHHYYHHHHHYCLHYQLIYQNNIVLLNLVFCCTVFLLKKLLIHQCLQNL